MHYTIELLIQGNKHVFDYYENAKRKWQEIMSDNPLADSDELSKILTYSQFWFEHNCGSRWIGQEIMVVTGISQFYTTDCGFDENQNRAKALLVYEAFMKSYCSLEVKGVAEDVAKSYHLIEG